jgi:hypothetical protein
MAESLPKKWARMVLSVHHGRYDEPFPAFRSFCAYGLNNRFTKYGVIMALSTAANFAQFK